MTTINTTWHHIRRSPIQSFTALILMTFSFIMFSAFLVVNSGLSRVLDYFETKPEITLFIKDGIDNSIIEKTKQDLSNYSGIKEVKYISKEKALEIYKQQNKDNPMLTEMVTANILPASFEVTVSDASILEQIYQNYATKTDVVDEIIYQKDIISSLLDWTRVIRKSGLTITLVVIVISLFSIASIIGMKTTNRKDEIKISRLLGASNFYVKKPFLSEGLFYGFFGSLIGALLVFTTVLIIRPSINSFFNPVEFITNNFSFYGISLLLEIAFGCLIGLFASWIGVKRYIKF